MALSESNKQTSGPNSVNAINSDLNNVGNTYGTHIYQQTIINVLKEAGSEFQNILPPDLELSNPKIAKKVTALHMDYIGNLDIDEAIKSIYNELHKICFKNLEDNNKYRAIKNIINIIPNITAADLELINKIADSGFIDEEYTKGLYNNLIDLGLLKHTVNKDITDQLLQQRFQGMQSTMRNCEDAIKEVDQKLHSVANPSNSMFPKMSIIPSSSKVNMLTIKRLNEQVSNKSFVQFDLLRTKEFEVIAIIIKDIKNDLNTELKLELEARIWEILNIDK